MKYEVIEAKFSTFYHKRTERVVRTFDNRRDACIFADDLRNDIPIEDRVVHDFYIQEA